jgi:hypothetical protein
MYYLRRRGPHDTRPRGDQIGFIGQLFDNGDRVGWNPLAILPSTQSNGAWVAVAGGADPPLVGTGKAALYPPALPFLPFQVASAWPLQLSTEPTFLPPPMRTSVA